MKRFLAFILAAAVMLSLCSIFIKPKAEAYDYVENYKLMNVISSNQSDSYQVVFLGDSEVYSGVSPLYLYKETGLTSFDCSYKLMRLCDIQASMEYLFTKQSPSLVFLNMSSAYYQGNAYDQDDDEILSKAARVFPYLQNHLMYKTLPNPRALLKGENRKEEYSLYRNFRPKDGTLAADNGSTYMSPTDAVEDFFPGNEERIISLKKLCEDHNAKLVLLAMPSSRNWNMGKHNACEQFSKEQDIPFLDLNTENVIDWNTETYDGGDHMNIQGSMNATAYIGRYIMENFDLKPEKNDEWDQSLARSMYGGNQ